ncbi:MAG: tol-pal system protein YbgF [Bryobacteraceae bacterium]|jgi:tol-pal system protein YbgF
MIRRLGLLLLIVSLTPAFAVDKTILELAREVGSLSDQVKQLQQTQDKQLAALQVMVQQSIDASNRADKAVAIIQSSFQQSGNQLKDQVVGPVVGLSTRMDQVSGDVRTLQQAVADLTSAMSKIGAQLSDLNNAIKVLSTPPPPPPQSAGNPSGAPVSNTPPMNQTDLYNAANGDYNSGKFELAMQEFQDFLKYYGNADFAPNAQYWIGQIYYSQKKYDDAVQAFDMVLEKYPENAKTRDAMIYKGMSLVALGKRTQAHSIFADAEKTYPGTEAYNRACTEDKAIGFNCAKPVAAGPAHKKK